MGLAVYDEVVIRVKINGNYGDDFETFLGVKQGDPLSMDLFGTMIEVISEMIKTIAPSVGVQVGDDKVSHCLFVDYLTLITEITENAHDLQCATNIVEMFALLSASKLMLLKRNIMFSTRITYLILIFITEPHSLGELRVSNI